MIRYYERKVGNTIVIECATCSALVFRDDELADWRDHVAWHDGITARLDSLEAAAGHLL